MNPMKPSLVSKSLLVAALANRPIFLWGSPGVGKSSMARQLVDALAAHCGEEVGFMDIRASLLDPVELMGVPSITDGRTRFNPPDWLPKGGRGVLLLDELNSATPAVQGSLYGLCLERRVGEYKLPDGWVIVAAGNLDTDRGVTHRMPTPLANRFVHVQVGVDLDDWQRWALKAGVATEVISFLRFRGREALFDFDPRRDEKAFPSPRSWEFVSDLVKAGLPPEVEHEMVAGTVGRGAAAEFVGYLRLFQSLVDPDLCLLRPDVAPVPDDASARFALAVALGRKVNAVNAPAFFKYINRLPEEFMILAFSVAADRPSSGVSSTREFIEFTVNHADMLGVTA